VEALIESWPVCVGFVVDKVVLERILLPISPVFPCHCHSTGKVKVKCTLVQALRLYTGRTAHSGSRDIALPFLDHGTRRG